MKKNKIYSYGRQCLDDGDITAVVNALKSNLITQGPRVEEFESCLARHFGSRYVTCVSNGTAALHLTGLSLGWKTGDIVITSPITFVASANAILYSSAIPDFVDIDPSTYTIDADCLEEKIKQYHKQGKQISAVIGVDYAGHPCDWEALNRLAKKYGFQLVDDACHAIGSLYKNIPIGTGGNADATVFSFHAVKNITTGEGGAILTNNEVIDKKTKQLRNHGIIKEASFLERGEGCWYYEMQDLGFNYRLTDIQCALGINQLRKIDEFIHRRREVAAYYNEFFRTDERFIIPAETKDIMHSYHLYPLQIRFELISIRRKELFSRLEQKNIFCQVHYLPVHLQPYYRDRFKFRQNDFPNAELFYSRQISLPIHPGLEDSDLEYISQSLMEIVNNGK
ncbi:MAG: perosamine synthetase [Syntrophus sp. SKADARSKE-3]|nr:perosamine synthetase [Syntrophus sp. SKADARSKE-3]